MIEIVLVAVGCIAALTMFFVGLWLGLMRAEKLEEELQAEKTNRLLAEQGLRKLAKENDDLKFWRMVEDESFLP